MTVNELAKLLKQHKDVLNAIDTHNMSYPEYYYEMSDAEYKQRVSKWKSKLRILEKDLAAIGDICITLK